MTSYQYTETILEKSNKFTQIRDKINFILLFLFALNAIFLPADTFQVKKIALFLLLAINYDCFLKILKHRNRDELLIVFFGFLLTSFSIGWSFLLTGNLFDNIRIGYVGYILLLYPIIKRSHVNFIKLVGHIMIAMAYFVVIMGLLDLIGLIPMHDNPYLMWIYDTENALVGKGSHLATGYVIFMKTSPMLFLSLAYAFLEPRSFMHPVSFSKIKYVNAIVISIALFLSGTRANLLICVVFALFCYVYCKRSPLKQKIFMLAACVLMLYFLGDGSLFESIWDMFVRKASSDEVRNGIMESIFQVWEDNPIKLFLGSGFSQTFYNAGRGEYSYNVELSFWNLLRQLGIPLFVLTMVCYLYPAMRLLKEQRNTLIVMGYVCYLIVAYTNPLLHSSTGMTVLLFMYCLCFEKVDYESNQIEEDLLI